MAIMNWFRRRNNNAITLKTNLNTYIKSYILARNTNNKDAMPPINAKVVQALKLYINAKRPKVAANAAAAVRNAGGSNTNAAKAAAGAANANSTVPSSVGAAAAKPLLAIGAPPNQVAAAAAGAAQAQAQVQRQGPAAAQQAGAEAAAQAARQALPNATPMQQARIAANGAEAANVNAKRAALASLLNGVTNNNITSPNGKSIAEVEKLKANLEALNINNNRKTAVLRLINNRLRTNVAEGVAGSGSANINAIRGAVSQNTNVMNQAQAREEIRRLNVLLKKVGQVNNANLKSKINNYRRRLNSKVLPGETGAPAPLELNVNVPGMNTKVKVKRNNPGSNWYFANSANNARYNLNNRNQNVPKVRNVSSGNLFKQGN
jgi:hypothetical protein